MPREPWSFPTAEAPAPSPVQARALSSVEAAVQATIELLEELPTESVTLREIRTRSGVSNGSLSHHFGSREGLIAAAQVERYARTCREDAAFLSRLREGAAGAQSMADAALSLIAEMRTPERHHVRWVRMAAVAAAFGDDALDGALAQAFTALIDATTESLAAAQGNGLIDAGVDPRSAALLAAIHTQGLVLDDLMGEELPVGEWGALNLGIIATFLTGPTTAVLRKFEHEQHRLPRADTDGTRRPSSHRR